MYLNRFRQYRCSFFHTILTDLCLLYAIAFLYNTSSFIYSVILDQPKDVFKGGALKDGALKDGALHNKIQRLRTFTFQITKTRCKWKVLKWEIYI